MSTLKDKICTCASSILVAFGKRESINAKSIQLLSDYGCHLAVNLDKFAQSMNLIRDATLERRVAQNANDISAFMLSIPSAQMELPNALSVKVIELSVDLLTLLNHVFLQNDAEVGPIQSVRNHG